MVLDLGKTLFAWNAHNMTSFNSDQHQHHPIVPTQSDLMENWIPRIKSHGKLYVKFQTMHAHRAESRGTIETVIRGETETVNTFEPGDYILHGTQGERYVLSRETFQERYFADNPIPSSDLTLRKQGYDLYRPKGRVLALRVTQQEVDQEFPSGVFLASWGSEMKIKPNDYLATPHPAMNEVYRIESTAFSSTYKPAPL